MSWINTIIMLMMKMKGISTNFKSMTLFRSRSLMEVKWCLQLSLKITERVPLTLDLVVLAHRNYLVTLSLISISMMRKISLIKQNKRKDPLQTTKKCLLLRNLIWWINCRLIKESLPMITVLCIKETQRT
jgi:hypothetical protein